MKRVTAIMLAGKGDLLPVSAFPVDGTWPTGTTQWEKRAIALEIPVWDSPLCIQCNKCALICPHAAIRAKFYPADDLAGAPATFKSMDFKSADVKGEKYTIQVAPDDCTGCTLCVEICPAESKTEKGAQGHQHGAHGCPSARRSAELRLLPGLPDADRTKLKLDVKGTQFLEPLFEFSGACTGCGETPYIKLLTQLYGDRAIIANATGCSLDLRRQPADHALHQERRGARPGLGQLALRGQRRVRPTACGWRSTSRPSTPASSWRSSARRVGDDLVKELLEADQADEVGHRRRSARASTCSRAKLAGVDRASRRAGSSRSPTTW